MGVARSPVQNVRMTYVIRQPAHDSCTSPSLSRKNEDGLRQTVHTWASSITYQQPAPPGAPANSTWQTGTENRAQHQGQAQPLVFGSPLRPSCPICAQRPSSTATAEPPGYEEGAKLPCYNLLSQTTLAHTFRARACRTRQLQLSRLRRPRRRHSEHRLARA